MAKKKKNEIVTKLTVWLENAGDGTIIPRFFKNEKNATKFVERSEARGDIFERLADDIVDCELIFDEDGNLLTEEEEFIEEFDPENEDIDLSDINCNDDDEDEVEYAVESDVDE